MSAVLNSSIGVIASKGTVSKRNADYGKTGYMAKKNSFEKMDSLEVKMVSAMVSATGNTNVIKHSHIMNTFEEYMQDRKRVYDPKLFSLLGISDIDVNPVTSMGKILHGPKQTMADISVDPNANISNMSIATIMQDFSKGALKFFCLKEIFQRISKTDGIVMANNILDDILTGALYPSDLHLYFAPYCYNFSASQLMYLGLPFIPRTPSKPPKHAGSFIQQFTQLIMYASNHQSGAASMAGFFVAYAYYAKKDNLTDNQILQDFQNLVYTINQPVRLSAQTPFVNLSVFDKYYIKSLYADFIYPDHTKPDLNFVGKLQKMFVEWFSNEMKSTGKIFTFPVLTANILLGPGRTIQDHEFADWATKVNEGLGFLNFYMSSKASSLSSCCRLSNDLDMLQELGFVNSFGAGGDGIGSVGVVTINLPHLAALSKQTNTPFRELIKRYADRAARTVNVRRFWVKENIESGFLPLYDYGFIDLNSQYSTIGFCGMWESAEILEETSTEEQYLKFASNTMSIINKMNLENGKAFGNPFNLEQVPAEGQAVQLAAKDKVQGLTNYPLYSNQWIPLTTKTDYLSRIHYAGKLDKQVSGGAILHLTTADTVDAKLQKEILKYCAKQGVVYFAFNFVLNRCEQCRNITTGDIKKCPICGSTDIEVHTRVVGFITPTRNWHEIRRKEFAERYRFNPRPPATDTDDTI